MPDFTAAERKIIGRARSYGTMHARKDRDEDRVRGHRQWDSDRMVVEMIALRQPDTTPELIERCAEAYAASYVTKWQLIGQCDHEFKQKGERSFGTSDGARCIHCGVAVTHGSALSIPGLTEKD
jgi:hypothetical protein